MKFYTKLYIPGTMKNMKLVLCGVSILSQKVHSKPKGFANKRDKTGSITTQAAHKKMAANAIAKRKKKLWMSLFVP